MKDPVPLFIDNRLIMERINEKLETTNVKEYIQAEYPLEKVIKEIINILPFPIKAC